MSGLSRQYLEQTDHTNQCRSTTSGQKNPIELTVCCAISLVFKRSEQEDEPSEGTRQDGCCINLAIEKVPPTERYGKALLRLHLHSLSFSFHVITHVTTRDLSRVSDLGIRTMTAEHSLSAVPAALPTETTAHLLRLLRCTAPQPFVYACLVVSNIYIRSDSGHEPPARFLCEYRTALSSLPYCYNK